MKTMACAALAAILAPALIAAAPGPCVSQATSGVWATHCTEAADKAATCQLGVQQGQETAISFVFIGRAGAAPQGHLVLWAANLGLRRGQVVAVLGYQFEGDKPIEYTGVALAPKILTTAFDPHLLLSWTAPSRPPKGELQVAASGVDVFAPCPSPLANCVPKLLTDRNLHIGIPVDRDQFAAAIKPILACFALP